EVRKKYLELFTNGHLLAIALHTYEDSIYICASNNQELVQLLANCAQNPDYSYVLNLFKQYCDEYLGGQNGALSLDLIVISDELAITLEKGFNLLKQLLLPYAFFGRGLDIELINIVEIQQFEIDLEFLVLSQEHGTNLLYTINIEICICTCFIRLSGAPCKHQGHISKDHSFYVSLHSYTSNEEELDINLIIQ
ncbi:25026_t:CDS:2, partial [Gigaspora margarita]